MKFTLPLSVLLLAIGAAEARPGWNRGAKADAAFAKRQTSREEINNRAHIKDTVKRVHNVIDSQVELQRKAGNYKRTPRLNVRDGGPSPVLVTVVSTETTQTVFETSSSTGLTTILDGDGNPSTTSTLYSTYQTTEPVTTTETITRDATTTIVTTTDDGNGNSVPTTIYQKRGAVVTPAPVQKKRRALADEPELVKKSNDQPPMAMMNMRPRGQYPRCDRSGAKTGYAHYPGWKLTGDDLSGGIPVTPESACVQACNKYGGACSGIYFDSNLKRCFLKGVHTTAWEFDPVSTGQSTDLVGGCALWANVVPPEMDAVCCRN